jgi:hypothetical protein
MAKFDPILGPIRGSIGANTFSRNKGGSYVKMKGVPTNPNSTRQQVIRTLLQTYSSGFSGLTSAQIEQWKDYAEEHPLVDALGQQYYLSGHQWYVRLNVRLDDAGDSPIVLPPGDTCSPALATLTVTFTDAQNISVAFTATPLGAGDRLVVWQSMPVGLGSDPNFRQCRLVSYSAAAQASPCAMVLAHDTLDGSYMNFFAAVQDSSGQQSAYLKDRELYTAP